MLTRRLSLIVLLVLLATAARLFMIQAQSIWFDEGWSAYAAEQPTLAAAWDADATNPPLYYLLINIVARGFGTSEFSLRYLSLLLGILTIPLVYQLARRAANPTAGGYAALLAAISAPLWWASQEARMYTLLALLIVICALAWQQLMTKLTRAAWIALWLGELALLYAHNTGPVAALWLNVVTVLYWLAHRPRRQQAALWLVGQVGIGLLWLPYFASRFVLLQGANSAITSAPPLSPLLFGQLWLSMWIAPWALAISPGMVLALLALLIGLVTLVLLRRRALWLLLHVVTLTVGLVAGLVVLGNELHGRYLIMMVPLLLAALGVGLASVRRDRLRLLAVTPFVLLSVLAVTLAKNPDYQHDDARGMVQFYADHLTADDSVIAWSYADRYDLAYYWDRLGVTARRITLPEGADLDAVLPLLPAAGDVALNVWYTQRADYRGMMGCLLGSGTVDVPESFTTYGMTTLVYEHPTLNLPPLLGADLDFTGGGSIVAHVDAVGKIPDATADRALCLPVRITLPHPLNVDLKAALIVRNDLGWVVASADAIFATANQRTTSAAQPGEPLTAYPLLRLPYGAPAGEYRVYLRIYDETANPSGYNPPYGLTIWGRDLELAGWSPLPGADWASVERTSDLPNVVNLPVSDDLTLVAHNLTDGDTLTNGAEIRAALLWRGAGALPELELADESRAWSVAVPARADGAGVTLDWRAIRVPPDVPSGEAVLRLSDGTVLAHYPIEALPMLTEAPDFAHAVGVEFPGVGELVGYTLMEPPFSRDNPPQVTLVWRAGMPTIDYTVTAQLIDAAGQVIAQSDQTPGARPTTGWRAGEYIMDAHTLSFNENAAPGSTMLIVAVYNPADGSRVSLIGGADAAGLQKDIEVR
jgi:uncharacterized membrane protein